MKDGIHYLQITDEKSLTPLRKKCIQSVKDTLRTCDNYELISIPYSDNPMDMISASDQIRFEQAIEIPNLCYVDTDCFLIEPLFQERLESDKPYFAPYEFHEQFPGCPDTYYFYVNGCCDYFARNLNPDKLSTKTYSFPMELLLNLKDFNLIQPDTFIHIYQTMTLLVQKQKYYDLRLEFKRLFSLFTQIKKSLEIVSISIDQYETENRK
jgi:hypothetical protein